MRLTFISGFSVQKKFEQKILVSLRLLQIATFPRKKKLFQKQNLIFFQTLITHFSSQLSSFQYDNGRIPVTKLFLCNAIRQQYIMWNVFFPLRFNFSPLFF